MLVICTYPLSLPHLILSGVSGHLAFSFVGGHNFFGSSYSQAIVNVVMQGDTFQCARWILFDLMFRTCRSVNIKALFELVKVMSVFAWIIVL
jgi:hypothetical protein